MGKDDQTTRRQFLKGCARGAGVVAVGAAAAALTARADADKVWQLNPVTCTTCRDYTNAEGWGRCATACVRTPSAVKAVNDFKVCGYCFICPAYFDEESPVYTWQEAEALGPYPDGTSREGTPKGLVCPQDAIRRRVVRDDPEDPYNSFYEYTIDESKCNGCGKCVAICAQPNKGNASLRLEVRHDVCLDCNQCAVARSCPAEAFYRGSLRAERPGYQDGASAAEGRDP